MKTRRHASPRRQSGAATLVIVLMLFFVVALVAAYTSRNLIFEQRTSVNQYRSTMAFEAADSGIEWALGLLNGGRIGANCLEATAGAGATTFRQRYLAINPADGLVTAKLQPTSGAALRVTCVWTGTAWDCDCPTDADPVVAAPVSAGLHPAFSLRFFQGPPRSGVIRLQVNACIRMDNACLSDFSNAPQTSEGRAQHSTLLVLKPALTTAPGAALTVIGDVSGAGAGTLTNADPTTPGVTLNAVGVMSAPSFTFVSAPGRPGPSSVFDNDIALLPDGLTLAALRAAPIDPLKWERVFGSFHGLLPSSYRDQPSALSLTCAPAGCRAELADLVARNPGRVIWVRGDLVLESAGDIGSLPDPANPALAGPAYLVVEGGVRFLAAGVRIFGVVYARNGAWDGAGQITGAAVVEGDLVVNGALQIAYDKAIIDHARLGSGSFVMLNGEWRDFVR